MALSAAPSAPKGSSATARAPRADCPEGVPREPSAAKLRIADFACTGLRYLLQSLGPV